MTAQRACSGVAIGVAVALAISGGGCSWTFMTGPPAAPGLGPIVCDGYNLVAADIALALLFGVPSVAALSTFNDCDGGSDNNAGDCGVTVALFVGAGLVLLVPTVLHAASARSGIGKASRCSKAKANARDRARERQEQRAAARGAREERMRGRLGYPCRDHACEAGLRCDTVCVRIPAGQEGGRCWIGGTCGTSLTCELDFCRAVTAASRPWGVPDSTTVAPPPTVAPAGARP